MQALRFALVLSFVAVLGGCPKPPAMQLYGARIQAPSPLGVHMVLTMKVKNHYPVDLQIRNVRAAVVIARHYQLPPIVHSPNQWLPAGTATFVQVPVTIPWHIVTPLLATTVASHIIGYQVQGFADVTAVRAIGIDRDDFTVDENGSVSRFDLVMAAGRGVFQ
jgi:hypothetical protein